MPKKSSGNVRRSFSKRQPTAPEAPIRVPAPVDGIQVNTCRNAACRNFGVEPLLRVLKGRFANEATAEERAEARDDYRIIGSKGTGEKLKRIYCKVCGSSTALKSNMAVKEELDRITAYLDEAPAPACENQDCASFRKRVDQHPKLYHRHGKTRFGTPRWKCKGCKRTVTAKVERHRPQEKSHENRTVFMALINKNSIRGMSRMTNLSPQTVYDKIDFIHRQCMAFVADRERRMHKKDLGHRYISVDRQDYVINWSDRKDRRPTQLTAVASADNRAGYVYGMNLNFDPDVELTKIEFKAIQAGDFDGREPAFRTYARYWMELDLLDHQESQAKFHGLPEKGDVFQMVKARQAENDAMDDPEDKERLHQIVAKLPGRGAQVHFAYTVQAHFRLLERLLRNSSKVRFFMDQDETLRAGCLSAFAWKIKNAQVDAFFVRINKALGIDTKRQMVAKSKMAYELFRQKHGVPGWPDRRIRLFLIREALPHIRRKAGFRDAWLHFPEYLINEPEKAVAYLTDRGDYGLDHLAAIYSRASMHAVDRYFMQIRRLLMMLERPINSASSRATWNGYAPYNPAMIQKLLDIFRVHYNYCKPEDRIRKDAAGNVLPKRTPAMKLGLAKGLVRIEDILYFNREDHPDRKAPPKRPSKKAGKS